jgi:glutaredoxin
MKVVIYSTPGCHNCDETMQFLEEKKIPYTKKDASMPGVMDELQAKLDKETEKPQQFPVVFVDDKLASHGKDNDRLAKALGI